MNKTWLTSFFLVLAWSLWQPKDYLTWVLEVAPAIIALVLLISTRQRFPLSTLAYWLILAHCIILMIGGHYTYAEVPLFDWLREPLGWGRNNYDKVGHFAQGFVPAIAAREVIQRNQLAKAGFWSDFFAVAVCLAFSALYELFEWGVALSSSESAEAFLGTQGYVWDTQSDMAFALLGAILAIISLGRLHDRQIKCLPVTPATESEN